MDKVLVSIVVPVYNSEKYVLETLNSAIQTDYQNFEIIIVDDGSIDNSGDICDSFAKEHSCVKVFHIENAGVSHARNFGIEKASGEYILPLDSDDKIDSSYVRKAVDVIQKDEHIGIVYCEAEFFGKKQGKWELPKFTIGGMLRGNIIFNCGLFRKCDWATVGGYDENLIYGIEDYDFWLSILGLAKTVVKIPEILFHYRRRSNSRDVMFNKNVVEHLNTEMYIVRKHRKLYQADADILFDMYMEKFVKLVKISYYIRKVVPFSSYILGEESLIRRKLGI